MSEGCRNCYAESVANRFKGEGMPYEGLIARTGQWNGKITVVDGVMDQPLRWRKPRRIFVNSMSDLFHENVPDEVIDRVFAVMALAHWHTFQVLTKRPERMQNYLSKPDIAERIGWAEHEIYERVGKLPVGSYRGPTHRVLPLPNVWIGVSVEDQKSADERIPLLLQTPAAVRWISAEPLLAMVDISKWLAATALREIDGGAGIDWVVVGGESGKNARPMSADWARLLRDQCADAGVPFLFKQWGEYAPCIVTEGSYFLATPEEETRLSNGEYFGCVEMVKVGKKSAGRALDGVLHDGYPMAGDQ